MSKAVVVTIIIVVIIILLILLGLLIYWRRKHKSVSPTYPTPSTPLVPATPTTPATSASVIKTMQGGWGTLESGGNCLTAIGNIGQNSLIEMTKCVDPTSGNNTNQLWKMTNDNFLVSKANSDGTYCLDVDYTASIGDADGLHFWNCNQTNNKKMGFKPNVLSSNPPYYQLVNNQTTSGCIDSTPGVGKQPILQTCNTTAGQQWVFRPSS